jgi:hypothetical protein
VKILAKKGFQKNTSEATNAHSTTPASPLKPRRQASANLTAAYACTIAYPLSNFWFNKSTRFGIYNSLL